jgi:transcriptional regulator with XRE-family HTH domain
MTFGEQLRAWRIQKRMSQRELAEKCDIDFTYLSKIENGKLPPPSQAAIIKLAEALEQSSDALLQLASKVPQDVAPIIAKSREAPALLRAIDGLSNDQIKHLTEMAHKMKDNSKNE